jgi:hypothetical protein
MRTSWGNKGRRRAIAVLVGGIVLLWSAIPAVALTPEKVVGGVGTQYWPSSNGTYLAWTNDANDHSNVYVKALPDGTPQRVNPKGTSAAYGSFVGTSNVLVYEEWGSGARGDIFFYDVDTGITTRAPAAVSRPATWDYAPMASDNYIAFVRNKWSRDGRLLSHTLLLYDRLTTTMTTLEAKVSMDFGSTFVGSTYVVWWTYQKTSKIHYWTEADGERVQPTTTGHDQYAGFIDETTGDLYFVRSRSNICGGAITIRRGDLGTTDSTVLTKLPSGIDTDYVISVTLNPGSGHLDLYTLRWNCKRETGDIYALRGVDTV